jgi:hypothetical protein
MTVSPLPIDILRTRSLLHIHGLFYIYILRLVMERGERLRSSFVSSLHLCLV